MVPAKSYATFGPVRGGAHPLETAGALSRFIFGWTRSLLDLGNKRQLAPEDLWDLTAENKVAKLTNHFAAVYASNGRSLLWTFFTIYWGRLAWIGVLKFASAAADLYGPAYVVGQIIAAVEAPTVDTTYVLQLTGSLFLVQVANALVQGHVSYMNELIGLQLSSVLRSLLFTKALRLSPAARKVTTAGDLANLYTLDATNVMSLATSLHQLWLMPLQIGVVLYLLYTVVGWPVFVGVGVGGLVLVINGRVAGIMSSEHRNFMQAKDARLRVSNEVFSAIQIIKFNAWEEKFLAKIHRLRSAELHSIWRFLLTLLTLTAFTSCTPIFVSVAIFTAFTMWMQQTLTVAIVFSTIALLKSLQNPLSDFPAVVSSMIRSLVSAKRINDVLSLSEVDPDNVWTPEHPIAATYAKDEVVVDIDDGTFGWDKETPLFRNINLKVKKGELVVVHGAVGQGKSSLCSILLGEMHKAGGSVFVGGRVAYFAQQSWIQNTTIRENILFGKPYDRALYRKVLDACALTSDLAALPAGDRTEIGQKGINLSGGQKARISLARACYSDADIFLLDSPLSAVDAIVASEIFSKCFLGLLSQKTVLLVTHNPEIIESKAVHRTFLVQDGQLIESTLDSPRTLQEVPVTPLQARTPYWEEDTVVEYPPAGPRHEMLLTPSLRTPYSFNPNEMLYTPPSAGANAASFEETGRLIAEEERAEGRVSKEVVVAYLKAMGGCCTFFVVAFSTVAMQVLKVSSDLWLTHWSNDSEAEDVATFTATSGRSMGIYAALALGSCLLITVQTWSVFAYGLRGSQRMFDAMLVNLLQAPMRFFDTNPIGRILNRFGDDVTSCDLSIPFSLGPILFETSSALFTLATTLVLTQWLGLFVLPLLYVYYRLGAFFLEPLREVNRIWKTTRSPLISLVSEGIDGSTTIRAFGAKQLRRFYRLHHRKIETFCECRFAYSCINQWFSIRIQLISNTIVGLILVSIVVLHDDLSPGIVGLLITYGLSIPANLMYLVNIWSQLETSMISPERIHEYIQLESEGARETSMALPADWPATGKVEFADVSFRYKPTDPLVLKNVSFAVAGGEKIGIVGRTGAGKSSLMMALFRMNDVAGGKVAIDGVDIATVGLKTLRSHLAIIPQNPVLFKGTLRNYLDPFEEYTDEQLWAALAKVQMTDRVSADDGKLLGPVDENGENFSVGERQMLCMARALLRQAKVVVLDEATAAIDHETDKVLQRVIRTEFAASTVLTIAHRLDTVLDCDRIMVFDQGTLVQCDTPKTLVDAGDGIFYELVTEGGYMDKIRL
ncbi:multidrug resistance-associated protein 1 [Achlya hypogyna]|uniref:Multidrug resistance-associated protein 1 n=1 Tax=Achlya hypogyna TaxID=1202772 RepID=A0A1V9YIC7_ACHHY|nr:multidrug resistance-associated protein 1 [Achlya hypogyna]